MQIIFWTLLNAWPWFMCNKLFRTKQQHWFALLRISSRDEYTVGKNACDTGCLPWLHTWFHRSRAPSRGEANPAPASLRKCCPTSLTPQERTATYHSTLFFTLHLLSVIYKALSLWFNWLIRQCRCKSQLSQKFWRLTRYGISLRVSIINSSIVIRLSK